MDVNHMALKTRKKANMEIIHSCRSNKTNPFVSFFLGLSLNFLTDMLPVVIPGHDFRAFAAHVRLIWIFVFDPRAYFL